MANDDQPSELSAGSRVITSFADANEALLTELAKRVERFELHKAERALNNVMRGHRRLGVTMH